MKLLERFIYLELLFWTQCHANLFGSFPESEHNVFLKGNDSVRVNKCCEPYELLVGKSCVHFNNTHERIWQPMFTSEKGERNLKVNFR